MISNEGRDDLLCLRSDLGVLPLTARVGRVKDLNFIDTVHYSYLSICVLVVVASVLAVRYVYPFQLFVCVEVECV